MSLNRPRLSVRSAIIILMVFGAAGVAWPPPARGQLIRRTARTDASAKPVPLVNADDEMAGFLASAQKLVDEKAYDQAIRILQALIVRSDAGFVSAADKGRYVALGLKANEMIGKMGPDGLKLYRELYDPQAQAIYEEGLAKGDPAVLRKVASQYLHTTYGPKALEAIASMDFDRGRFAQAARTWARLTGMNGSGTARPLLLAKVAVAWHLAGDDALADKAIGELKESSPQAQAAVSGQEQNLLEFLQRARTLPAVAAASPALKGWPGLGGLSEGIGTMDDVDMVLAPQWRSSPAPPKPGPAILESLVAGRKFYAVGMNYGGARPVGEFRNGRLRIRPPQGGPIPEMYVPSMINPVVIEDIVIFRCDEDVFAHDAISGQEIWRTRSLPIERNVNVPGGGYYFGYGLTDTGRYSLTAAEGKIFLLYGFRPPVPGMNMGPFGRADPTGNRDFSDTSGMAAISVEGQGRLVWQVGLGVGEDELIRNGKFISLPGYHAGRLYVVMMHQESYYLACLDAATGALLWKTPFSQAPAMSNVYGPYEDTLTSRASPPVVSGGKVFAVTNAGVVAGFDLDSGSALWAYQYDSDLMRLTGRLVTMYGSQVAYPNVNPVMVSRGRVICLPADSGQLLALSCEDGTLDWSADRSNQVDLSAVGADRVLLSGPGLLVLSAADGTVLFSSPGRDIFGRPAVTPETVLASGEGKLYRMRLGDYTISSVDLASPDGLLGNLVSHNGKLIAANALGICAYFSYDRAFAQLSDRVNSAQPADRPGLLFHRGQLSFNSSRFGEALKDLLEAKGQAAQLPEGQSLDGPIQSWLHRTYIALGNSADKNDVTLEMFQKALACAASDQDRAHMTLRLAKAWEKGGDFKSAAATAQELAEKYGGEELNNVPIGPAGLSQTRFDDPGVRGAVIAQELIRKLIAAHGREVYARFDAVAAEAMDKARQIKEPEAMLALVERWPESACRFNARLEAAEIFYQRAASGKAPDAAAIMEKAVQQLHVVASAPECPPSLRASADAALAVYYSKVAPAVTYPLQELQEMNPQTPVAFADIRGKVGDILQAIEGGRSPLPAPEVPLFTTIKTPLREAFALGDGASILRDQDYEPVRVGERLLVLQGDRAVMLDLASADPNSARKWEGLTGVEVEQLDKTISEAPGRRLIAGLSKDKKLVVVASAKTFTALDIQSARVVWRKTPGDFGLGDLQCFAAREGVLAAVGATGNVVCVDLASSDLKWRAPISGAVRPVGSSPAIGGGAVLVQSSNSRTLTCLSVATGKIVGVWNARQAAEGALTDEGLLVTMIDGELAVRNIQPLVRPKATSMPAPSVPAGQAPPSDKAMWSRKYPINEQPTILAVSGDLIAVSPRMGDNRIEVLSISGAVRTVASLRTANIDTFVANPVDARFDGKDLYVICSAVNAGRRVQLQGHAMARGLSIQKFSCASQRLLWACDIDRGQENYYRLPPLTIGRQSIAITAQSMLNTMGATAYVIDAADGKVRERIVVSKPVEGFAKPTQMRYFGSPAMTNGHLCVETTEGVTVYDGQ